MKPHFFSIITSVYNAQSFIKKAMCSVKEQTEKDFEYIIVDNGSNDESNRIIKEFIEDNPQLDIKLLQFKENQGISGGRNAGIEKATGTYVCFLDADDYWYSNKLEVVKRKIKETKYGAYCHWENHVKNESISVAKYRKLININAYEDLLFNGNCLSTSAMVIDAQEIKAIGGFDRALVSGEEDFDCWLRLAKNGTSFYMIEEVLGAWLIREDSISAKHIKHTEAVVKMLQGHFDVLQKSSNTPNLVKKKRRYIKALNYCSCGRMLAFSNDRKQSNQMYIRAIKEDPTYVKSYAGILLNVMRR